MTSCTPEALVAFTTQRRKGNRVWCITVWSTLEQSEILEIDMSHAYKLNEDVRHKPQGPQGRAVIDPPMIYTIIQHMPIEADGRLRYRIRSKSENIERVVTEDQLSYFSVI